MGQGREAKKLEVPLIRSYNYCMMNEKDEYKQQIDILFSKPAGSDMWNWLRRRTSALMERELYDRTGEWESDEEIGSSDVSGRLYELWLDQKRSTGSGRINDSLGFQINSLVKEYECAAGEWN